MLPPLILAAVAALVGPAMGAPLDTVGVTLLRAVTTNLNGTGIPIAHPEASLSATFPTFEVNPAAVGRAGTLFTYHSALGTATNFPNTVGAESAGHGNGVGYNFYGIWGGIATNVARVDNYDADYFITQYILTNTQAAIPGRIANQSYIFLDPAYATNLSLRISEQIEIDSAYDNYAAKFGTLFVSGAGNEGRVYAPATAYNGIGVGVSDTTASSCGPTLDNGRCKPDITAPGGATSFSAPYVAGAAAVLMQAGLRGDGGSDTNAAVKIQTIKALLLNGAVKPANWTNAIASPLDARHGAGVLNVFNSYRQLAGGRHASLVTTTVPSGSPHPPTGATGSISALSGWDFATLSSSANPPPGRDACNHYYFNVTNGLVGLRHTLTATLVWNRQEGQTSINDLDLFLYDCATSNLIAQSISGVDNVEHLHASLPPGRYDLQVWKAGGSATNGNVTASESYALAWAFFSTSLNITRSGTNAIVSWPIYPDGFVLQSASNPAPSAVWSTVSGTPAVTNGVNRLTVGVGGPGRFYRLKRP